MKKQYFGERATFEVDHKGDGRAVITGPDELDRSATKDAYPVVAALVNDETVVEVIYDASNMVYLDSMGLGTMLGASKHLQEARKTFAMQNVGGHVLKPLEITNTVGTTKPSHNMVASV